VGGAFDVITLGVLVSGSGTNLQAIFDAIAKKRLDARVAVVLSNRPVAFALERAGRAGIPTVTVDHKDFAGREAFDAAVVRELRTRGVEWVVLAGFMRIITPVLLDAFPMRVINIHPALLPSFPGTDAQRQAIEHGVRVTGCTVHFVDTGTDTGPIIAQRAIDVLPGEDVESLKKRLLEVEHALLPEVLQWIAEGRVEVVKGEGRARVLLR
jgi:phosphoribosylglycinamide formyltransferase 1